MNNSMIRMQVIGLGAAGNKCAISLVQDEIIPIDDVLLVNSTKKDIPQAFLASGNVCIIGDDIGGCGQERSVGKEIAVDAIKTGNLDLESFVKPEVDTVIIIASTEGGTGSGSAVVVAKYLRDVLDCTVIIFAITGFGQFPRNIWNTLEYFKELQDNYHIEIVSNKAFLDDDDLAVHKSQPKAEAAANKEIGRRIKVLTGQVIMPSEQNIDLRDLRKLTKSTGWCNVEYRDIESRIKNKAAFNEILKEMIDQTKSMDPTSPEERRLGVIISLPENEMDSIDHSFSVITNKYGIPYEMFKHIQISQERFIAFISAGMKMPMDDIKGMYDTYRDMSGKVNKGKDEFFDQISELDKEDEDDIFDLDDTKITQEKSRAAKASFFDSFGVAMKKDVEVPTVRKDLGNY